MRLGDLDALKEDLKQYFSDGVLDSVSAKIAFTMVLRKIDNAPTVTNGTYEQGFRVGAYGRLDEIRPKGECKCVTCKCRESCSTFCETYNYKLPEKM